MKKYDEMTRDVFRKIEENKAKKQREIQMTLKFGAPVLCACLMLAVGIGAWSGGYFRAEPAETLKDAVIPGIKDWYGPDESSPYEDSIIPDGVDTAKDKYTEIYVNKVNGSLLPAVGSENHGICLFTEDFVSMTFEELEEYYGTKVVPQLPEGIAIWGDQRIGIYRRDGGNGEVYFDWNSVNYANEDHSRSVNVVIAPEGGSAQFESVFLNIEKNSRINGVEVAIAADDAGEYYAEFLHNGLRFQVFTEDLSESEMISVISSLTE